MIWVPILLIKSLSNFYFIIMEKPHIKKEVRFVIHVPRESQWQFRAQYNDENGDLKKLVVSKQNNKELLAMIKWPAGKRIISIPENKKDINGVSYAEFIKNSPYCKGSPICDGDGVFFEYNPKKDAEIALAETEIRLDAEVAAFKLKGQELKYMAAFCGCFDTDAPIQKEVVCNFAKISPRAFLDMVKSKGLLHVGVFKIALSEGVIVKKGFSYEAEIHGSRVHLGNSEDAAISKLANEQDLFIALEDVLNKKKK